jgi:hypothetical protein
MCTIEHLPFSPMLQHVHRYIYTPYSRNARPPAKTSLSAMVWWQKIYPTLTPPQIPANWILPVLPVSRRLAATPLQLFNNYYYSGSQVPWGTARWGDLLQQEHTMVAAVLPALIVFEYTGEERATETWLIGSHPNAYTTLWCNNILCVPVRHSCEIPTGYSVQSERLFFRTSVCVGT